MRDWHAAPQWWYSH